MNVADQTAEQQAALWNGLAGRAWIDAQSVLDDLFEPFEQLLVDAVRTGPAGTVLDVGCGTGATTLAVARALGADGACTGVDVSDPMIAVARERAERERTPARFVCADAQTHAFAPASFDMVVSRFGVMFFADPVRAFANLRRAARDGAGLRLLAWRSAAENPFMTTAQRAAAPLLPQLPARAQETPDVPGQFAFADRERVHAVLAAGGWDEIELDPIDVACTLPERELLRYVTRLGPLGLLLGAADDGTRAQVIEAVRTAFDPYVHGAEVRFTAACWSIGARAGGAAPPA